LCPRTGLPDVPWDRKAPEVLTVGEQSAVLDAIA
jgi:hypothetical protein